MSKPIWLKVEKESTVRALLLEENPRFSESLYVVLIDGQVETFDAVVKPGQRVVVLPRVAGG